MKIYGLIFKLTGNVNDVEKADSVLSDFELSLPEKLDLKIESLRLSMLSGNEGSITILANKLTEDDLEVIRESLHEQLLDDDFDDLFGRETGVFFKPFQDFDLIVSEDVVA